MNGNVSVLVPIHDGAGIVSQAVENILSQTRLPGEIVIADDGSRDGLVARLAPLRTRCHVSGVSLRYVRSVKNRGRGAARNLATNAATGDLVAWFDVDDLWSPGKLAAQMRCFERLRGHSPPDKFLLTCNYARYDASASAPHVIRPAPIVKVEDIVSIHRRRHVQLQTVFGSRKSFLRHSFDEDLNRAEDFDFSLRFTADGGRFMNCDHDGPALVHYFRSYANWGKEAVDCNRRAIGKNAAIFRSNHVDPDAFLTAKIGRLQDRPRPLRALSNGLQPRRIAAGRHGDATDDAVGLIILDDGGLRLAVPGAGEGEYVAESSDHIQVGRGLFSGVAEISHAQIVNWFMAGGRWLVCKSRSGKIAGSVRLRIYRMDSGLVSLAI